MGFKVGQKRKVYKISKVNRNQHQWERKEPKCGSRILCFWNGNTKNRKGQVKRTRFVGDSEFSLEM